MALGVWRMELTLFEAKLRRGPQGKMHFVGRLYVFVGGGNVAVAHPSVTGPMRVVRRLESIRTCLLRSKELSDR
jgi:hypothetical protein